MMDDKKIDTFIKQVPKIELHAHLNGCVRESTLIELARERKVVLSSLLIHQDTAELQTTAKKTNHEGNTSLNTASLESHQSMMRNYVSSTNDEDDGDNSKKYYSSHNKQRRSLSQCFEIFTEVAKCVNDLKALERITCEALEDFANENVAYLELRSTPKELLIRANDKDPRICTKKEYVGCILKVMEEFSIKEKRRYEGECRSRLDPPSNKKDVKEHPFNADNSSITKNEENVTIIRLPMITRFIISINRSSSVEDAIENASLAAQLKKEGNQFVVGMDLSGNPLANNFLDFMPAYQIARKSGLKFSIHCGEVPCGNSELETDPSLRKATKETEAILTFQPDRLGHALLLPDFIMKKLENKQVHEKKIPIECCPTSNVMTLELARNHQGDLVQGLRSHPRLADWLQSGYPISISTDDPGIFNTTSSQELSLLIMAFFDCEDKKINGVSSLISIIIDSVDHIFESYDLKKSIKILLMKQINTLANSLDLEICVNTIKNK